MIDWPSQTYLQITLYENINMIYMFVLSLSASFFILLITKIVYSRLLRPDMVLEVLSFPGSYLQLIDKNTYMFCFMIFTF